MEDPSAQTAAPTPTPPAQVPPGSTAPATMPPRMDGRIMQARIQASLHLGGLERVAMMLGGTATEDGREIMQAVIKLRKRFGSSSQDVSKAEVKSLGEQVQPVQQPTPGQGQALQQAVQRTQRSQGLPAPA